MEFPTSGTDDHETFHSSVEFLIEFLMEMDGMFIVLNLAV
jgi:hypothetical protein